MRVVICGGGVIAACTAYFLARDGVEVIVVERNAIAGAASGKAGGFLALDWCAGSPLDGLARRSFALHAELAADLRGNWGHRGMNAYSGTLLASVEGNGRTDTALNWVSDSVHLSHRIGTPRTTAIVHPRKFTQGMTEAAQQCGAQVRMAQVTDVLRATDGAVHGVVLGDTTIEADATVVAMGPWSIFAARWVPLPPVFGQQSPSLVYQTDSDVGADALFLEYLDVSGEQLSVEVFPRADGSTHITAFSAQAVLPPDPADVAPDPRAIARLQAICEQISPAFRAERIVARQSCFRPITRDYLPLIGRIAHAPGAYIATGHNVWGILNAPATGEAMAQLISEGESKHVDLAAFDPARLPPLEP